MKLVQSLVFSNLDWCNSVYTGMPNSYLRPLQKILHSAVRLVIRMPRFSYNRITPVCINLHVLPIKARIKYKICVLTYKALKYGQPTYLAELLHYRDLNRSLRGGQSRLLFEPIVASSSYSNRCFEYSAPRMFNSLP